LAGAAGTRQESGMSSQYQASDPDHRADAGDSPDPGAARGAGPAPEPDPGQVYYGTARTERERERERERETPRGPINYLVRRGWQGLLVTGVAAIVLGALVLAWPGKSLVVVSVMFGVYLLVSGAFQIFSAFGAQTSGGYRALAFISGALSVVLGLFCFRSALESIFLLAIWIGVGWLFRGISLITASASDPEMPARGWQGFVGVISAMAGVVLMVAPFGTLGVLTLVAGIWLVVVGVVEVIATFAVRHRAKDLPHRL
jgi:uncharacterized membrane protein HdeD (DUF308 family)